MFNKHYATENSSIVWSLHACVDTSCASMHVYHQLHSRRCKPLYCVAILVEWFNTHRHVSLCKSPRLAESSFTTAMQHHLSWLTGRQPQPEASQSQIDPAPSSRVPSQGGWGSDATSQPAKNGWDDQPPPYTTATPTRGRGKGRGSSSRGRAGPAVQPPAMQRDAEPASDGWGAEASATEAGQGHDGWGDAVAADFPGLWCFYSHLGCMSLK